MIENKQVYISYIADGAQTEWECPYQYVDSTDINLYVKHDGVLSQISSSLYSFNTTTNKITYPSTPGVDPVAAGDIVLLTRNTDVTQLEDSQVANFKSNDVERMTDKLTMICQELQDGFNRSIHYNQLDAATGETDAAEFMDILDGHVDYTISQHNTSAGAHTAKFATKQDVIEDLSTIRSNATAGKSASDTIATYGDIVTHDTTEFATAAQGAKADTALQQVDVTSSYSATGTAPVNGTAVASAVSGEATIRQSADTALQGQIDGLKAASDVVDVVASYADLQSYDTSKLTDKDLIKVLSDSTHSDAETYYRWSASNSAFSYVGSAGASYTKAQADAKFLTQTAAASTYIDNTALAIALATKASSADGVTITDSGSAISTVAVKEQRANTAIKQWVGTKAQYEAITTKDANTVYVITDETDAEAITVDSALSATSIHPVQNKVIYDALQNIDALPSQSGQSGKFLTTNGTAASWATVEALPSQTGNNGKFLTTNGTTASWSQVVAYPTLTWFTGTTGTALSTTLDLANANLVKVYKNGMLLEDSNSPDAKIIKYTALNAGNRLLINTPFNFSAANTWEIDLKITPVYTNNGVTLIGGIKDYYYPGLSLTGGSIKSAYLFISSSGTAWNISNTQYAAGPYYEQQTYTVKASYDGAQYSVYNTNVSTQETTGRVTATTTAKQIYDGDNSKITLLGYDSSGNFNGTFYFSDFKIKLDNTVVFDGQTAEEGVDYTNYGCTKTVDYVYNKDYLISNNTINFSTALQATDKITVEVF